MQWGGFKLTVRQLLFIFGQGGPGWRWLGLALLLPLGGCQSSEEAPETTPPAAPISIMVPLHQNEAPPRRMLGEVERLTEAKLDIEWIADDNYREKMVNALETNSLKQVTYIHQPDYVLLKNPIRSGMFWEIGPYLQFYPNLKQLSKETLNETSIQGKIYGLYTERPASRQGIIVRKDWLDRLKLKAPSTLEELYAMLRQFTYNDPDGNGARDTIGLADRGDLTFGAFKTLASYMGAPNNWTVQDGRFVAEFETAAYVETMNYMKRLLAEGLMNADFAVTSKQVQRYMLVTGKAGAYIGNLEDGPRLQEELQRLDPKAELTLINRIGGPLGERVWSIPGYSGLFLFSKKSIRSEEELRRILAFFDRTMEKAPANMLKYGIDGEHYTVRDGRAVVTPEMYKRRDEEVLPLTSLIIAGQRNPNVLPPDETDQPPMARRVRELTEDNEKLLVGDPARALTSATYDTKGAELSPIIADATFNYILGRTDLAGFRAEVELWKSRGGAAIAEEYNKGYPELRK